MIAGQVGADGERDAAAHVGSNVDAVVRWKRKEQRDARVSGHDFAA